MGQEHLSFVKIIGKGGFGTVYLADLQNAQQFRNRIAVKVLNEEHKEITQVVARQQDEARLLGLLNHKNIIKVYDMCQINGQLSVLMEYLHGVNLTAVIRHGAVPFRIAVEIIAECADALDAAFFALHPQTQQPLKVIHRDIKPSNILLGDSGLVKILDFGIAKGDFERECATSTHQIGTARYMAPEQWMLNASTEKVDIYALGLTLLELLHGELLPRLPLDRTLHQQTVEQYLRVSMPDIVSTKSRDLLRSMLAFEPKDRLSAGEVRNICLDILDRLHSHHLDRDSNIRIFAQQVVPLLLEQRDTQYNVASTGKPMLGEPVDMTGSTITNTTMSGRSSTLSVDVVSLQPDVSVIQEKIPKPSLQTHIRTWFWPLFAVVALLCVVVLWGQEKDRVVISSADSSVISHDALVEIEANSNVVDIQVPDNSVLANVPQSDSSTSGMEEAIPAPSPIEPHTEKPPTSVKKQGSIARKPMEDVVLYFLTISSVPLGADVFVDGKNVGKTLLPKQPVPQGTHHIRLEWQDNFIEQDVVVDGDKRVVWKVQEAKWLSF